MAATPGPWHVRRSCPAHETEGERVVAEIYDGGPGLERIRIVHYGEAEGGSVDDAHLLAAAPDLLGACKTTLGNIRSLKFAYAGVRTWDAWEALLERVIVQAQPDRQASLLDGGA